MRPRQTTETPASYGAVIAAKAFARALAAVLLTMLALGSPAAFADPCPVPTTTEPGRWENERAWQALAAQGYRVGAIHVVVKDVFELDIPQENTWYGRTADALHRDTLPGVVKTYLLFDSGQPVDPLLIYESVRRLHGLSFLRFATIAPESCGPHTVDVLVIAKDAWSLKLDIHFSHSGGQSTHSFSFEDVNFYGTGKTVGISRTVDAGRTSNELNYQDPALFGSRLQLDAAYSHLSDGHIEAFSFGQPFFEDSTTWSFFVGYLNQQQFLNFYDDSNLVWRAQDNHQHFEFDWTHLVSWQDDWGTRAGVTFLRDDYFYGALESFPPVSLSRPVLTPRQFAGPGLTWEYFEDHYATYVNMALIDRAEDYNMGWDTHVEMAYFAKMFNSPMTAWLYDVETTYGAGVPGNTLLLGSAELQTRRQSGAEHNLLAKLALTLYNQYFHSQTLVAHLDMDYSVRSDPENLVYIGGLQGMPGYPNYLYLGDRRWQLNLADRYFTGMRLWNVFQVGFAAYGDVGRVRLFETGQWSRTLADVGLAVRLGDIRSAYGGVIYISYAWPLVNVPGISKRQFLIGNTFSF